MSLLTKDQMEQIPALYATENIKNPIVHLEIKCGNATWLITEFDFRSELMFGFCEVVKGCGELGYVSLKEIEELNEIYFIGVKKINKKLNEAKKELGY